MNTPGKSQLVINFMQISFKVWDKIQIEICKNDLLMYFFIASCFLAVKVREYLNYVQFDSSDKVKDLETWVCEQEFNLELIEIFEKLILNECEFQLFTDTPNDVLNFILQKFSVFHAAEKSRENIMKWIEYAISQFEIYRNYDYTTITFACCLVCFSNETPENASREEMESLLKEFIKYIKTQKIVDPKEVENCGNEIIFYLQDTSDDDDDENQKDSAQNLFEEQP